MPAKKAKKSTPKNARPAATHTFQVPESEGTTSQAGSIELGHHTNGNSSGSGSGSGGGRKSGRNHNYDGGGGGRDSERGDPRRLGELEATAAELARRVQRLEERPALLVPRNPYAQLFSSIVFFFGAGAVLPYWFGLQKAPGVWMIWVTICVVFLTIANLGAIDIVAWEGRCGWVKRFRAWWGGKIEGGGEEKGGEEKGGEERGGEREEEGGRVPT